MGPAVIALLVAAGGSVWVYTKLQNHTGYGNSRSAAVGAVVVFVVGFIVIFSIGHMVMH